MKDSKDPYRAVLGSESWELGPESLTPGVESQLLLERVWVMGAASDCRPPGEPQRRESHLEKSVKLGLSRSRPVFPYSFVILPVGCFFRSLLWGLWSFTRWTLESGLPGACLPPADPSNFFWPIRPAQLGWRAHLLPWFAVQMETQRWPRVAGEDRGSDSRALG